MTEILFWLAAFLSEQFYYYVPLLFFLAISGSFAGKKIVNKISQPTFKKLVLAVIILVSSKFVYDGITYLI